MEMLFEKNRICAGIYRLIISALLMETQLLKGHCLDFINRFNLTTFWYLFQARTWISNVVIVSKVLKLFCKWEHNLSKLLVREVIAYSY
jgi:hypothetical protein